MEVAEVAKTFFKNTWDMLLETDFPGLGVSFAAVLISVLLIRFSVKIFGYLTGFGMGSGDYGKAANMTDKLRHEVKRRQLRNGKGD